MNIKEATLILEDAGTERQARKNLRDTEQRIEFLTKWIGKYTQELSEMRSIHSQERAIVKALPSAQKIKEAQEVVKEWQVIEMELSLLKKKKRRMTR